MGHTVASLLRRAVRETRGPLAALDGANDWLNSAPLTESSLKGKVVLVNFCTYTCINWLRQLPYVRAWEAKYRANGLVVIGAHTPEFGFEHDLDNVRRAVSAMQIPWPVAIDNEYAIWNGFSNHYWPALYLIDASGRLQYQHFGEGEYERTENFIQHLLAQSGTAGLEHEPVVVRPSGVEAAADWSTLRSPENYLGSARTEGFVRQSRALQLNEWRVEGDWQVGSQWVALSRSGGRIIARFHARDLHLVMGPVKRNTSIRFRVTIDGQAPAGAHGFDIDEDGAGTATDQRLYQLVRQPGAIEDRSFAITFLDPGIEAFAFTFG